MPEAHKTVFISYRRSVGSDAARAVFLDLRHHGYDVFLDVDSINSGQFDTIILRQIEARAHFVLILTPGTLERCAEQGDWLRREIEYAMEKQRNIVLLLYRDFSFAGTGKYLTGKLTELSRYNGMTVPHDYFDAAMEKLRSRFLIKPADGVVKPAPASDQAFVQRKIEEAAAQLAPAPTDAKLSAEDYFNMAMALDDNSEQEIAYYTEAIRLNSQYAAAYSNRGIARKAQGNLTGAIADYDEAIRLNPQFAAAYNNRGIARRTQGDLNGALADYDEAIRLNPQIAEVYNNRGNARKAQGDLIGAIVDYDEAIRFNPQYDEAYYNRGNVRREQGDLSGAIGDYQKYLDLGGGQRDGDQAEVEQRICALQAQLGSQS